MLLKKKIMYFFYIKVLIKGESYNGICIELILKKIYKFLTKKPAK